MKIGITYFIISSMVIFSCSPSIYSQIPGKYVSVIKDSRTIITLLKDGRFIYEQNNMGVTRTCYGKWVSISKNKIRIECEDQKRDVSAVLSSGFMEPVKEEVIFITKRKIKLGETVLKRVESESHLN